METTKSSNRSEAKETKEGVTLLLKRASNGFYNYELLKDINVRADVDKVTMLADVLNQWVAEQIQKVNAIRAQNKKRKEVEKQVVEKE